jgi:hypothetical protein
MRRHGHCQYCGKQKGEEECGEDKGEEGESEHVSYGNASQCADTLLDYKGDEGLNTVTLHQPGKSVLL